MKIIKEHINESLHLIKNEIPFNIKKWIRPYDHRLFYHFKDWDTDEIIYGYDKKYNRIWFNDYSKIKGERIITISREAYTLNDAKNIIINDYIERNK